MLLLAVSLLPMLEFAVSIASNGTQSKVCPTGTFGSGSYCYMLGEDAKYGGQNCPNGGQAPNRDLFNRLQNEGQTELSTVLRGKCIWGEHDIIDIETYFSEKCDSSMIFFMRALCMAKGMAESLFLCVKICSILDGWEADFFKCTSSSAHHLCEYEKVPATTVIQDTTVVTSLLDAGTVSTTTQTNEKHQSMPTKTRDRRKKVLESVTIKVRVDSMMSGESVFTERTPIVTMCARFCMRSLECTIFNYNAITRQCVGFGARNSLSYENNRNWEVWAIEQIETDNDY